MKWQPTNNFFKVDIFILIKIFFQLEILEMLAMAGADLNAKNKNEETPSGIWILVNCCVDCC